MISLNITGTTCTEIIFRIVDTLSFYFESDQFYLFFGIVPISNHTFCSSVLSLRFVAPIPETALMKLLYLRKQCLSFFLCRSLIIDNYD